MEEAGPRWPDWSVGELSQKQGQAHPGQGESECPDGHRPVLSRAEARGLHVWGAPDSGYVVRVKFQNWGSIPDEKLPALKWAFTASFPFLLEMRFVFFFKVKITL